MYSQRESVTAMITKLGWESLKERRDKSKIMLLFKVIHQEVAIPATQLVINEAPTRGHSMKFHQIATWTNYYKHSFFPSAITLWNALPQDLISLKDVNAFRTALSAHKLKY